MAALLSMIGLPYVVMQPGPITNTLGKIEGKQLITVKGAETYPTTGALDFTTVRVLGGPGDKVNAWEVLWAAVDPSSEVFDEELVFPKGLTSKEVEEENTAEMVGSQQEAIAVALRALGKPVTETVTIAKVAEDAPSASKLRQGDEIVAVDGQKATSSEAVRAAIQKHQPGEAVALTVERERLGGGRSRPRRATPTDGPRSGSSSAATSTSRSTSRSTPATSAGRRPGRCSRSASTTRSPRGRMTGGQKIAGTGTIDSAGEVGPIGGIRQKLVGARDGGADYFLAPADNCDEVVGHVPDGLRVVRVSTFDEARQAVQDIAAKKAQGLPTCTR